MNRPFSSRALSLSPKSSHGRGAWGAHGLSAAPARAEWGTAARMLPAALDLFSPWALTKQGLGLVANAANATRFRSMLAETQSYLRAAHVPILLKHTGEEPQFLPPSELKRRQRRWLGQVVLELYFSQLLRSESAIVDLWPSRLGIDSRGDAVWSPRPLYLHWAPEFLSALRDFYAGFFLGDAGRFERGSQELGLGGARDLLLQHMGEGNQNQRAVRFDSAELRSTLEALPALPHGHGSLHQNFMAFGLYVTSLHTFLESLDLAFDVRSAFLRSYVSAQALQGGLS
jgi:hypothetical protein